MPGAEPFIDKLPTGISGLDLISKGGLPRGRTTLVCGTAGSAKTVFAAHFLAAGVARGEPGVFVTFEEPPEQIRRNMRGFGWDIAQWEAEGKWLFVDASPAFAEEARVAGEFEFGGLIARIESAARQISAQRAALDSVASVFSHFADGGTVRRELHRIADRMRELDLTTVLTAERSYDYGEIARHGVEEFVADNVIILRNVLEDEKRRRTIEILKFRGTDHQKGEWPFTVKPDAGVVIIPLSATELTQRSSDLRITSGIPALDEICGGGFFRDSIVLVSGATGTGKTLMVTHFIRGGAAHNERCLLIAFEESRDQLFRNAAGWGVDFAEMERNGQLRVVCEYPESGTLEDHLIRVKEVIEDFNPDRVAVDSLSALERVSTLKGFRESVIGLTSFIKEREMAGLFTATTASLLGGSSVTETHISTITDSIILLRYVELYGEMRRGITVLKMRGSRHEKAIREFQIDATGMHIGRAFKNVTGILSGNLVHISAPELERMGDMFREEGH
jgi:circadian clock protein KaiC